MSATSQPHILLINPNSSQATTRMMHDIAQAKAGAGVQIRSVTADRNPTMIVNESQLAGAAEQVIELGQAAGPDCQGVIVSAYGDPGVEQLKAALQIPVIGICEASMIEASQGGRRFGVATVTPDLARAIAARADQIGLGVLYTGIRCSPGDPEALANDPDNLRNELAAASELCIADGAEAVIIGGGPLGEAAETLQGQFSVPIIAPITAAVRQIIAKIEAGAKG